MAIHLGIVPSSATVDQLRVAVRGAAELEPIAPVSLVVDDGVPSNTTFVGEFHALSEDADGFPYLDYTLERNFCLFYSFDFWWSYLRMIHCSLSGREWIGLFFFVCVVVYFANSLYSIYFIKLAHDFFGRGLMLRAKKFPSFSGFWFWLVFGRTSLCPPRVRLVRQCWETRSGMQLKISFCWCFLCGHYFFSSFRVHVSHVILTWSGLRGACGVDVLLGFVSGTGQDCFSYSLFFSFVLMRWAFDALFHLFSFFFGGSRLVLF